MKKNCTRHQVVPPRRLALQRLGALALASAVLPSVRAAAPAAGEYPNKPMRILIGYAPGGSADVSARITADALQEALGQSVVVENQPGASGTIAARAAARAAPDGYTLLLGNTSEISVSQFLLKDLGFQPLSDLIPVAPVYHIPHAIAVPAASKYQLLKDLLEDAQANPNTVTFASAGVGTPGHLAGEMLALRTNTQLSHVPYKGGGQVLTDLMGGRLSCHFAALSTVMPHVKSGSLRVLALTSRQRVKAAPDVPTVSEEAGIADFDFPLWGGLFVPKGTPQEIVSLLNTTLNKAYDRPEVEERINALYSDVQRMTPEQFAEFLAAEAARYRDVIKESNVSL